jgi:hypothetical protein
MFLAKIGRMPIHSEMFLAKLGRMHFCCNGVCGDIYALTTMKLVAKTKIER